MRKVEMPEFEYEQMREEYLGVCMFCGEIADGIEPDARNYPCENCEHSAVYGVEELLLMGAIKFTEDEEV